MPHWILYLDLVTKVAPYLVSGVAGAATILTHQHFFTRKQPLPKETPKMDTPQQALDSFNSKVGVTASHLTAIANAVQMTEAVANQAVNSVGTQPTPAQKVAAAASLATAIDPQVSSLVTPVETLISSFVGLYNLFGIFKHKSPAPAPQVTMTAHQVTAPAENGGAQ